MASITENYTRIEERIQQACSRGQRPRDDVRLMAVTKRQPPGAIANAAAMGLRLFGENRVQEALAKRDQFPPDAEIHLIGHLQRNKARDAASFFAAVQSLDAVRTVEELERRLAALDRTIPVLIEVNTSGEDSKQGVRSREDLRAVTESIMAAPHLQLNGLMTIGPISSDERVLRPAFASLREMRELLRRETGLPLDELSMGMSNDLEAAILEGSTMIRVGTALFGERRE